MKLKILLLSFAVFSFFTLSSCGYYYSEEEIEEIKDYAYSDGYSAGEEDGYDDGYQTGVEDGNSEGYKEGYDEGYEYGKADGYNEAASDLSPELLFWRNSAVLVTETGSKYHRWDCQYVQNRDFWIYNFENAQYMGYSPCDVCSPPS